MGQVDGHHHAEHLVEVTGLLVKDVILPIAGIHHDWTAEDGVVRRHPRQVLDVLIEEARLNPVDGLGVGKMIDKINEPGGDRDLAQHFAFVAAGDRGDLGQVLRLEGNGLWSQLIAELGRQCLGQIAATIERDAEAAGIRPMGGVVLAGSGQGGGEENGRDSGFHLPKRKFRPVFFTPRSSRVSAPGIEEAMPLMGKSVNWITRPKQGRNRPRTS